MCRRDYLGRASAVLTARPGAGPPSAESCSEANNVGLIDPG